MYTLAVSHENPLKASKEINVKLGKTNSRQNVSL
jgi:hypothetical protein